MALRPRNSGAATEEKLAVVYLAGQAAVESRNWEETARWFEAVHQQRPGYLGNIYLRPLYDAYIANGDAYASAERYADAWDQYDKAVGLPVENTVVAIERRAKIAFKITPTPTPTVTPTAHAAADPHRVRLRHAHGAALSHAGAAVGHLPQPDRLQVGQGRSIRLLGDEPGRQQPALPGRQQGAGQPV